ncbi:MAG: ABC transporter substrate-binding protein [Spirochaetaceae bacterium]|jgi:peptide/nickel transport system substrate-binding protein|nr:ABC transporter substrate-binding protein [Spirochaetaceae bacterium]
MSLKKKSKKITLYYLHSGVCAAFFLTVVVLAGCSGAKRNPDFNPAELRVALPGVISNLSVNREAGDINYYAAALCQEGLVGISNEGKMAPALAESWKVLENGTKYVFTIRRNAVFQNGVPLQIEDLIFSMEKAGDKDFSPSSYQYFPSDSIKSIEKTGDYEITVTLFSPNVSFLWALSNAGGLLVTSKSFAEKAGSYGSPKDLIIGTGPYKPVEFTPSYVIYEAVSTWWGGQVPFKKIKLDFIEDANTRLLAFREGRIDFAFNIPIDHAAQWRKVKGATVSFIYNRAYTGITIDPTVEPFDDIHVRRAIAHSINKIDIVEGLLKGSGQAAVAIPAPEQFASAMNSDEALKKLQEVFNYDYSPETALQEIKASKTPNGFKTRLVYPDANKDDAGRISLNLVNALKPLGIELEVGEITLDQWVNEVGNGEQGMAWMIFSPTTADPGEITNWLLDAQGPGYNPANWTNEEAANLTKASQEAYSINEQINYIIRANSIAQEEAVYIPIFWKQSVVAFAKGVGAQDYNSYTLSSVWPLAFTKSLN